MAIIAMKCGQRKSRSGCSRFSVNLVFISRSKFNQLNRPINLDRKPAGKPIGGNRHDGFEAGNRLTVSEHESAGESLRQRQLRKFHEDAEAGTHNKYDDLEHLGANIEEFIQEYYNRQRLHYALCYRSPEEFEQQAKSKPESRSATMVFFDR